MSTEVVNIAAASEAPEWLTDTPQECCYELIMFESGSSVQTVAMSRGEFIALKKHLAVMRGIELPDGGESEDA